MAKIICVTSGLSGIVNASLEIVSRLEKAGHTVSCASPKNNSKNYDLNGIKYHQLDPFTDLNGPPLPKILEKKSSVLKLLYKWKNREQRVSQALKKMHPTSFLNLLDQESPDLLLIDIELHEYIIAAHSQGTPFLIISQWFSLWKRKGLPYLLNDITPSQGFWGSRMGIEIDWAMVVLDRWWKFYKKKLKTGFTNRRQILLNYAQSANFPRKYIGRNFWPGPYTYEHLPVLALTSEFLEFPHHKQANLSYVGPMVLEGRKEQKQSEIDREYLQSIINRKKKEGKQLLLCVLSTLSPGDIDFASKLIEAVRNEAGWELILSIGVEDILDRFNSPPDNVHVFSRIPMLATLKETNVCINHGGINSIHECLHYKVPMLIYSGKRSDQNGCSNRMAYHGIAIKGDKDVDDVAEIKEKIHLILKNKKIKTNLDAFQLKNAHYKNGMILESIIDEKLK